MGYRDYSTAKGHIVDATGHGDFSTVSAALTAATSGQTIFIRPGTYTENPTLVAGVDLVAFQSDALTGNVIINGNCTFSGAGTVSISGIRLQTNSAALLTVSGASASVVNISNCYLNCSNNTGITFSTANTSARINIYSSNGDLGTTGIGIFANSSTGIMFMNFCTFTNSGGSSTASTTSGAGGLTDMTSCMFKSPFSTSSSAAIFFQYCNINTGNQNTTTITTAGTGISTADASNFSSGTASTISIGSGTSFFSYGCCTYNSSNTNVITGSGTFQYCFVAMPGSGFGINATTVGPFTAGLYIGPAPTVFTPGVAFGGATTGITYSAQTGYYMPFYKNLVIFGFQIGLSSKGSASGNATITGLPFAGGANAANVGNIAFPGYGNFTFTSGNIQLFMQVNNGATTAGMYQTGTGIGVTAVTNTNFANNTVLYCNGFYFTN
jgi:hypothetical protein